MPNTREKLIDLLGETVADCMPTECLCEVADHLIANGVTVQKWIPVSERLPDWRDGKVLVFTTYGISICERTLNSRWKGQHANWITHWMPLPEPPEGV